MRLESGRQFASRKGVGPGAHALGQWLRRADVDGDAYVWQWMARAVLMAAMDRC